MKSWKDIQYLYDHNDRIEVFSATESKLKYPPHSHTSHIVIGIIMAGSVILNKNKTAQVYQEGQSFFVFPYEEHSIEPINHYSMVCICINQNAESTCEANEIESATMKTLEYLDEKFPGMSNIKNASFIASCKNLNMSPPSKRNAEDSVLIHVMKQIEKHPEIDYSIDALAHTAFMNKYYFIRRFQQLSGLTPHQFQIQCRLRKAQHQLAKSGKETTITAIALDSGFCDQSHFTRHFKKYTGITPGYYLSHCNSMDIIT